MKPEDKMLEEIKKRIRQSSQSVYREDFEEWIDILAKQLFTIISRYCMIEVKE